MQLPPSLFMASCTPLSSATIIPISSDPANENNYVEPNCPHGNMACWGQQQPLLNSILTITSRIKNDKFAIIIQ